MAGILWSRVTDPNKRYRIAGTFASKMRESQAGKKMKNGRLATETPERLVELLSLMDAGVNVVGIEQAGFTIDEQQKLIELIEGSRPRLILGVHGYVAATAEGKWSTEFNESSSARESDAEKGELSPDRLGAVPRQDSKPPAETSRAETPVPPVVASETKPNSTTKETAMKPVTETVPPVEPDVPPDPKVKAPGSRLRVVTDAEVVKRLYDTELISLNARRKESLRSVQAAAIDLDETVNAILAAGPRSVSERSGDNPVAPSEEWRPEKSHESTGIVPGDRAEEQAGETTSRTHRLEAGRWQSPPASQPSPEPRSGRSRYPQTTWPGGWGGLPPFSVVLVAVLVFGAVFSTIPAALSVLHLFSLPPALNPYLLMPAGVAMAGMATFTAWRVR